MNFRFFFLAVFLLVLIFISGCTTSKITQTPSPTVENLIEHNQRFEKRIVQVTPKIFCAIGYALSNSIMIVVDKGKVIVDTTESVRAATEIKKEFDRIAPGPVLAIIYTHTHPDHVLGTSVFYEQGVPIWATDRSIEALNEQFASLAKAIRSRANRQYGNELSTELKISNGIGANLNLDPPPAPPIYYPTKTFSNKTRFEIGETVFELYQAPGETEDQLFIWLPKEKVLLPGDNVYAAFPNLYSTRGVPPRPVRNWISSLDKMRSLQPEYLVPGHTEPVFGKEKILSILTAYRDAIRYVHDSVIRMANEGKTPDDMARDISLPPHLRNHPYLQEFYGKVSWSARGIYDGYLGWFDGNPTALNPLHPEERAKRLIPLLGGKKAIQKELERANGDGDFQWVAELADILLSDNPKNKAAKLAKADALWNLGILEANPNARCYLLTCAKELRGEIKKSNTPLFDLKTIRQIPVEVLIRSFPERLRPKKTASLQKTIIFDFTDTGRKFTFIIRNGIGEVYEGLAEKSDLKMIITEMDFKALLTGELNGAKALADKRLKIEGGLDELIAFQSYLISN